MTQADIQAAVSIVLQAGWKHSEADWARLLAWAPDGCLIAESDGEPLGTASVITYGDALAWIGMVVVVPEHRGKGLGTELTGACIEIARAKGITRIMLDASEMGRPVYRKLGFRPVCHIERWEGRCSDYMDRRVERMSSALIPAVAAFDAGVVGYERRVIIERLHEEFPNSAWVDLSRYGEVRGYLMARARPGGYTIGPWLHTDPEGAAVLLRTAMGYLTGQMISVGIPDSNPGAIAIAGNHNLTLRGYNVRMILGDARPPTALESAIYGIAGASLG